MWHMVTERLTAHVCCYLVVELDESRVHQWESLRVILIVFDFHVQARQLTSNVVDAIDLLADERDTWPPRRAEEWQTYGLAVMMIEIAAPIWLLVLVLIPLLSIRFSIVYKRLILGVPERQFLQPGLLLFQFFLLCGRPVQWKLVVFLLYGRLR